MSGKTLRVGPGCYARELNGRSVRIARMPCGWVAIAEWARDTYSDPCHTKREAIACADDFLSDAPSQDEPVRQNHRWPGSIV